MRSCGVNRSQRNPHPSSERGNAVMGARKMADGNMGAEPNGRKTLPGFKRVTERGASDRSSTFKITRFHSIHHRINRFLIFSVSGSEELKLLPKIHFTPKHFSRCDSLFNCLIFVLLEILFNDSVLYCLKGFINKCN